MTPDTAALHAALTQRQDALLKLAQRLLAFPTPNPPGRNTAEAQAFLADFLRQLGCTVEQFDVYPGDPDVIGVLPGKQRQAACSLLINGHIDVAEVGDPARWSVPPFAGTLRDGRLYGRGAADMKGGLAAALFALQVIREQGIALAGDVIIESVVGEEQGEPGTRRCIERGYRADFAIVPEPTELSIVGQGGVITGWIEIISPETLHDGMRARTIHAGGGVLGANAIEKMILVIEALERLERHWAVVKQYPGFPPGSTTINPAVIEGGRHPAFLADRCALWITVHFYPNEQWQDVVAEIESFVLAAAQSDPWLRLHPPRFRWGGESMLVDRGEIFPAAPLPLHHPGLLTLRQAHAQIWGNEPATGMWPSVSDAGWLADAGIPTVVYGPGSLTQAHTVDEWVSVEALLGFSHVLAEFIVRWCNRPKEAM